MKKYFDTIIIGGGVIGSAIAYYLTKSGQKVAILEKNTIASLSSGAAAGMLAAETEVGESIPKLLPAALKSRQMFSSLAEELKEMTGIDIGYKRNGMLRVVFTEEEKNHFLKKQAFLQWFSQQEVQAKEPYVAQNILGAIYAPNDAQVNAEQLTKAFAHAACLQGAEIFPYTDVRTLMYKQNKVIGVQAGQTQFFADQIVLATGAYTQHFVPENATYPVKGECFSVVTKKPIIRHTIFTQDCYIVPKEGARLIIGATAKPNTYNRTVQMDSIYKLMEFAQKLIPEIGEAMWERAWASSRPQTATTLPYLERNGNVILATGHYRNGILLSPITGQAVAEAILSGKNPKL